MPNPTRLLALAEECKQDRCEWCQGRGDYGPDLDCSICAGTGRAALRASAEASDGE